MRRPFSISRGERRVGWEGGREACCSHPWRGGFSGETEEHLINKIIQWEHQQVITRPKHSYEIYLLSFSCRACRCGLPDWLLALENTAVHTFLIFRILTELFYTFHFSLLILKPSGAIEIYVSPWRLMYSDPLTRIW